MLYLLVLVLFVSLLKFNCYFVLYSTRNHFILVSDTHHFLDEFAEKQYYLMKKSARYCPGKIIIATESEWGVLLSVYSVYTIATKVCRELKFTSDRTE